MSSYYGPRHQRCKGIKRCRASVGRSVRLSHFPQSNNDAFLAMVTVIGIGIIGIGNSLLEVEVVEPTTQCGPTTTASGQNGLFDLKKFTIKFAIKHVCHIIRVL